MEIPTIYGENSSFFEDNYLLHDNEEGYLAMSSSGLQFKNSSFMIMLKKISPEFSLKHLIFGKISPRSLLLLKENCLRIKDL